MRVPRPRTPLGWTGAVGATVILALTLFVVVAPYNVAARNPHLPGVRWLLHTYMQNSVRTWSIRVDRPEWADLDDPALVRLGAAHFESGCAPCHGAPGRPPNPLTRGMRPAPPPLGRATAQLSPDELYWIVWNGVKYTGMPAWSGKGRDDEPWALAAFLARYPALDADSYIELAYGPADPSVPGSARRMTFGGLADRTESVAANCARCHGEDGLGRDGTAPSIAGQSRAYLEATLAGFAIGQRASGIMGPIAATLSREEIAELAQSYAALPGPPSGAAVETDPIRRGRSLAARGTASTPSCLSCHGEDGTPPRNQLFPRLAGQDERFLSVWLHLWCDRPFGATEYANVMHEAARWLSDDEIAALAAYFSRGAP